MTFSLVRVNAFAPHMVSGIRKGLIQSLLLYASPMGHGTIRLSQKTTQKGPFMPTCVMYDSILCLSYSLPVNSVHLYSLTVPKNAKC